MWIPLTATALAMIVSMVVTDDKTVVHSNESCGEHSGNIRPPCFFPVPSRIAEGRHGIYAAHLSHDGMRIYWIGRFNGARTNEFVSFCNNWIQFGSVTWFGLRWIRSWVMTLCIQFTVSLGRMYRCNRWFGSVQVIPHNMICTLQFPKWGLITSDGTFNFV